MKCNYLSTRSVSWDKRGGIIVVKQRVPKIQSKNTCVATKITTVLLSFRSWKPAHLICPQMVTNYLPFLFLLLQWILPVLVDQKCSSTWLKGSVCINPITLPLNPPPIHVKTRGFKETLQRKNLPNRRSCVQNLPFTPKNWDLKGLRFWSVYSKAKTPNSGLFSPKDLRNFLPILVCVFKNFFWSLGIWNQIWQIWSILFW